MEFMQKCNSGMKFGVRLYHDARPRTAGVRMNISILNLPPTTRTVACSIDGRRIPQNRADGMGELDQWLSPVRKFSLALRRGKLHRNPKGFSRRDFPGGLAMWFRGLTGSFILAAAALAAGQAQADDVLFKREALWRIVSTQCVPASRAGNPPSPCLDLE